VTHTGKNANHDPPPEPAEMQREFETGVRQILTVTKADLDARLRDEKHRRKRRPPAAG